MSMASKGGGGSRASDEDGKTSVKVGMLPHNPELGNRKMLTVDQQLFVSVHLSNRLIPASNSSRNDFSDLWSK